MADKRGLGQLKSLRSARSPALLTSPLIGPDVLCRGLPRGGALAGASSTPSDLSVGRRVHDAEADALYIYLQGKPGQIVGRTQELGDGIAVDYTSADGVFGIEILDASERLGFTRGCPEVSLEQLIYKGARQ